MRVFEKKLNENTLMNLVADFKTCNHCGSYIERLNCDEIRVICLVCLKKLGIVNEFCWNCEKKWMSPNSVYDCGNACCTDKKIEALQNCKYIYLSSYSNDRIPSIRACVTCGMLVEHNSVGCKNSKPLKT